MKTNNLVRAISLVLAVTMATVSFAAEGQNGNGGGGVNIDGRYMTFFSAGLFVDKQELTLAQIPQLKTAIDAVMMSSYLPSNVTAQYFKALMPSQTRKYYNVSASRFTAETRARLISEYSRVMSIDGTKVALFAVTDTTSNTTYILPEFYSLRKSTEQAAILFHEAYWIVNPKATYQEVITAEGSFQAYLENANSPEALFNWLEKIVSGDALVRAAYGMDMASGVLTPLMVNSSNKEKKKDRKRSGVSDGMVLPLENIFGADVVASGGLKCNVANSSDLGSYCYYNSVAGSNAALQNLYVKSLQYPQSWLLKMLIAQLSTNKAISLFGGTISCTIAPFSKNEVGALTVIGCTDSSGNLYNPNALYLKPISDGNRILK